MESSIFWNVTPCRPLKISRRFGGICRPQQETRMRQEARRRWRRYVPKRPLVFNGLHSVISPKTGLFIITAVRASDPKYETFKLTLTWTQNWHMSTPDVGPRGPTTAASYSGIRQKASASPSYTCPDSELYHVNVRLLFVSRFIYWCLINMNGYTQRQMWKLYEIGRMLQ
jgi:hypothetical protein